MIDYLKEKAKHYDRSVILILTALGVIGTIYIGTQNSINRMIETSEIVQSLKLINAQQSILNTQFMKQLEELRQGQASVHDDVIKILFELKKK